MNEYPPDPVSGSEKPTTSAETSERPASVEDDATVLAEREAKVAAARDALASFSGVRERLGISSEASADSARLEAALVAAEANYPGDWTLALRDRLLHPSTEEKLRAVYDAHKESFSDAEPGRLDKPREFRAYQERHAEKLLERVERSFALTETGPAASFGKSPQALGVTARTGSSYEERFSKPGAVFSDAEIAGQPLTSRQKNLIEAHEKGHAVREFSGAIADEVRTALDLDILAEHADKLGYSADADEIVERMAQLKNYFGFKGDERFTKAHLDHVREHYLDDVGLDNSMTEFFAAITPEKEEAFLDIMNRYPI